VLYTFYNLFLYCHFSFCIAKFCLLAITSSPIFSADVDQKQRIVVSPDCGLDVYLDDVKSQPIDVLRRFYGSYLNEERLSALAAVQNYESARANRFAADVIRKKLGWELIGMLKPPQHDKWKQLLPLHNVFLVERETIVRDFEEAFRNRGGQGSLLVIPNTQFDLFRAFGLPENELMALKKLERNSQLNMQREFSKRRGDVPKPDRNDPASMKKYQTLLVKMRNELVEKHKALFTVEQDKILTLDQRTFRDEIESIRVTSIEQLQELTETTSAKIEEAGGKPSSAYWESRIDDPVRLVQVFLEPSDGQKQKLLDLQYRFPREAKLVARDKVAVALKKHLAAPEFKNFVQVVVALTHFEHKRMMVWRDFRQTFNPRARLPYGLIPRNMTSIGVVDGEVLTPAVSGGTKGYAQQLRLVEKDLQAQGWKSRPKQGDSQSYREFAERHRRVTFELAGQCAVLAREEFLKEDWFPKSLAEQYNKLADLHDKAPAEEPKLRIRRVLQLIDLIVRDGIRTREVPRIPDSPGARH
jgi:hypothetical protein